VTLRHRIRFYQQLAVLVRAGVPLRDSLQRLRERISGGEMAILAQKISAGAMIGDAFAAARFSPFECHLVIAGERSAQLETVFQHLSEFWTRRLEMRQALITQLYYPVAMLHLALFVAALSELAIGSWAQVEVRLVEYFTAFYAIGFAAFFLIRLTWPNEGAQRFWLRVPIIGGALSAAFGYRWITALKLEFSAGIPLPDAVADAWRASGYAGSERLAQEGQAALREGAQLSALVQRWKRLPRDWVDFIETGEISGALETALENLQAEALRASALAQQRLTEWTPKIVSFLILLLVGALVIHIVWRGYIAPIIQLENQTP
jgi:type II secretory pathway component PulF